jgi:hypothetical protein
VKLNQSDLFKGGMLFLPLSQNYRYDQPIPDFRWVPYEPYPPPVGIVWAQRLPPAGDPFDYLDAIEIAIDHLPHRRLKEGSADVQKWVSRFAYRGGDYYLRIEELPAPRPKRESRNVRWLREHGLAGPDGQR